MADNPTLSYVENISYLLLRAASEVKVQDQCV